MQDESDNAGESFFLFAFPMLHETHCVTELDMIMQRNIVSAKLHPE